MAIGFLLKSDMIIGLESVPVFDAQYKPLYDIPDKERYIEKFLLLNGMYPLMVLLCLGQRSYGEHEAK